jgi:hypothetical protein
MNSAQLLERFKEADELHILHPRFTLAYILYATLPIGVV